MLANLLDIWKLGLGENTDGFFNNVHAMSLELTKEAVQLSYYWARKENGGIKFYGRSINGWHFYDEHKYKKAHRYTRNALEWVREQALKWVCPALSALEDEAEPLSMKSSGVIAVVIVRAYLKQRFGIHEAMKFNGRHFY